MRCKHFKRGPTEVDQPLSTQTPGPSSLWEEVSVGSRSSEEEPQGRLGSREDGPSQERKNAAQTCLETGETHQSP